MANAGADGRSVVISVAKGRTRKSGVWGTQEVHKHGQGMTRKNGPKRGLRVEREVHYVVGGQAAKGD